MCCSRRALVLLALLAGVASAEPPGSGSITGKVNVVKLSVGSRIGGPADVLVYLEGAPAVAPPPPGPFAITQVDKAFEPEVLVVPVGAPVSFPNMDELFHNVFSSAPGNTFDLGLYKSGASRSMVFKKPGIVPIFCNIHPTMVAYIVVVTNEFHTYPGTGGEFVLPGVPPGRYTLVAWSPTGKGDREVVVVESGRAARVELTVRERAGAQQHRNKDGKPYSHY